MVFVMKINSELNFVSRDSLWMSLGQEVHGFKLFKLVILVFKDRQRYYSLTPAIWRPWWLKNGWLFEVLRYRIILKKYDKNK
jgi:hypothetical protein